MAYGVLSVIPGVRLFAFSLESNADAMFIWELGNLKTV